MIKKILAVCLILSMAMVSAGCSRKEKDETNIETEVATESETKEPEQPVLTDPLLMDFLDGKAGVVIDDYVFSEECQEFGSSYLTYAFDKGFATYTIDELMNAEVEYQKNENSIGRGNTDEVNVDVSYEFADLDGDYNNELIVFGNHENENHKTKEMFIVRVKKEDLRIMFAMNTFDSAFGDGEFTVEKYGLHYSEGEPETLVKEYYFDKRIRPEYIGYTFENFENGLSRYAVADGHDTTVTSIEECSAAIDDYAQELGLKPIKTSGFKKLDTYESGAKESQNSELADPENAQFLNGKWYEDTAGWYWLNSDSSCPSNCWQWCDGNKDGVAECYYFNAYGYCQFGGTTPDGRTVDGSGAWTVDGVPQVRNVEVVEETRASGSKEY